MWKYYDELVRGEREHYRVEKAYYRNDGTVLWTNLTVSLLRDSEGRPEYQLALMEDTTERRLLNLRLRYEATHDALTGLPNRTLFFERLEKALTAQEGGRFGLCYLDLDGFKAINDSLGHAAGDRLLVEVADRLQSCATAPGEMVARLGGDEFVALTTGPDTAEEVHELAGRILNALATPIRLDGRELSVRGSIGIVEGPAGDAQRRRGAAQRRHHDVPGQGGGRQPLPARRRGGRRTRHHPARADHRAPGRPGPGRVLHRVPAAGAPGRRHGARRGGARAVVPSAARGARPRPVHPARRAHRAHRAARPLGAGGVRTAGELLAGAAQRRRPTADQRQPVADPAAPPPAGRGDGRRAGTFRSGAGSALPGGDRVRPDRRRRRSPQAAAAARGDGRRHRARRLRHGLLEPGEPASAAGERPQAGPVLHPGHAAAPGGPGRPEDRGGHRVAGPQPGAGRHGGGRGDRRAGRTAAPDRLRHRPGLVLRAPRRPGPHPLLLLADAV